MLMKVMEAGAVDFIHKPFHANDVINIINRVFKIQQGAVK
jgi:FixJ family two-component response regulator